jgi:protein TonB
MANARILFIGSGLLLHGVFAVAIGEIEIRESFAATAIEMTETKAKPKETPPPPRAEIEPEPKQERAPRARAAAPTPAEPPPPEAQANPTVDAVPDFGLSLSGGVEGSGLALPAGRGLGPAGQKPAATKSAAKTLAAAAPAPVADECTEPPAKPKVRSIAQPAYTDEAARAAGIQGKVRIEITVDETGRVVDVKLVQGLSPDLDAAALAAGRAAQFEPAVRCGKPVRAIFKIGIRFEI